MRTRKRLDIVSLVAGVVIAALGIAVLLDRTGAVDMRFAELAPITLAVVGAILLASGLTRAG
jgi:hypothetical protein